MLGFVLLSVFPEEFRLGRVGECYLRDGLALVALVLTACKQDHVALFVKPINIGSFVTGSSGYLCFMG